MSALDDQLLDAAAAGPADLVRELLSSGADPDTRDDVNGWSALLNAIEFGHTEVVAALLAAGADVDLAMDDGWSPLHHAVDSACDEASQTGRELRLTIIRLLLRAGADPDSPWRDRGQFLTPVELALLYGRDELAAELRAASKRRSG